ncbi:GntR family transcriptional regulator [Lactobacillus delbrueckii subsp. bulgaricus]
MRENDPVYEIIRLRLLNDEPLVIEHTYMPVSQVPALSKRILEGSIYSYLHKKLHIKFGGVFHRIKADLPDKYDRQYLGANESTPILEIEQIVWTIPGSTSNILGQETSTTTGLISWSKPAIKLTKKYPLKESKSSVGISLLSYLLAL